MPNSIKKSTWPRLTAKQACHSAVEVTGEPHTPASCPWRDFCLLCEGLCVRGQHHRDALTALKEDIRPPNSSLHPYYQPGMNKPSFFKTMSCDYPEPSKTFSYSVYVKVSICVCQKLKLTKSLIIFFGNFLEMPGSLLTLSHGEETRVEMKINQAWVFRAALLSHCLVFIPFSSWVPQGTIFHSYLSTFHCPILVAPAFGLIFVCGASGKEPACQCRRYKRHRFNPWVRKIPWSRKWQSTPVFLLGEPHEQRTLAGYSPCGRKESDMTEHT